MRPKAPRLSWRLWRSLARGACLGLLFWLTGFGYAHACRMMAPDAPYATYSDLTDRYPHGVLGDSLEPTKLMMFFDGNIYRPGIDCAGTAVVVLDPPYVFEDTEPRLVELGGDELPEIVVVRSHEQLGAQLAIYGMVDRRLRLIAATPHIGSRNRWLAPAGIGDLDGDGAVELAYIDRPHLAKRLRIWRYENGALTHVADVEGLTNHRIGEDFISGGLRDCGSGPEIVTANADWSRLMGSRLADGRIETRDLGAFTQARLAKAMACK